MQLEFSPQAIKDLEEIGDYIALDNPMRSILFIDALESYCQKIAESPTIYPIKKEIPGDNRLAIYKKYLIFFKILEDTVRIERVLHSSRNYFNFF